MPELPDVEVFRRYLNRTALNKKIRDVEVVNKTLLKDVTPVKLGRALKGKKLTDSYRHGKNLFARLSGNGWLHLHFGMTGFLKYYKDTEKRPEHLRVELKFSNDYHLGYDSQRMLGSVGLVDEVEAYIEQQKLGPDPLTKSFSFHDFSDIAHNRRGSLKSFFMNQNAISGIGNVYSDEILFQSNIHPETDLRSLSEKQLKKLYNAMQRVLNKAIDYKVDISRFPDTYLLPNRDEGVSCPRCDGKIKKLNVSGRSTYYCDHHQQKD
jgi:formamidopyrimidine-DNA glycosylase